MTKLQVVIAIALLPGAARAQDKSATIIHPADARAHAKEKCTLEMTVRSTHLSENSGTVFLNSESDFKSSKNVTVVLFKDTLERFREMKVENPAEYYKGKMIRVTGRITLFKDRPEIKVTDPSQIEIVGGLKQPGSAAKPK